MVWNEAGNLKGKGVKAYVQPTEPLEAQEGDMWITEDVVSPVAVRGSAIFVVPDMSGGIPAAAVEGDILLDASTGDLLIVEDI